MLAFLNYHALIDIDLFVLSFSGRPRVFSTCMQEKTSPRIVSFDSVALLLHPMHNPATQKPSVRIYIIVNVIIPTNLVCVLFDPAIPTLSLNFI